jgi:hypothetical protein
MNGVKISSGMMKSLLEIVLIRSALISIQFIFLLNFMDDTNVKKVLAQNKKS